MKIFDMEPAKKVRRKFTVEWSEDDDRLLVRVTKRIQGAGGCMRLEEAIADFVLRQLTAAEKEMERARPKFNPHPAAGQDQI